MSLVFFFFRGSFESKDSNQLNDILIVSLGLGILKISDQYGIDGCFFVKRSNLAFKFRIFYIQIVKMIVNYLLVHEVRVYLDLAQ